VALAVSLHVPSGTTGLIVTALALAGLVAACYIARFLDPAWLLSAGIATEVFVGSGGKLGLPISPSRLLILAGSIAVLMRAPRPLPLRPQPLHVLLLAVSVWAIGSAFFSGTLSEHGTTYELLDRLGIVPFWLFFLAPLAFATETQRRILLGTMIVLGGYLALTAVFETLKLWKLVWPRYILDPTYGSHGDRARGPFVESITNGMGLFACGVAATMGVAVWRERVNVRRACAAVAALCLAGCLFTLTREVWLGTAIAALVTLAAFAEVRRFLLPAVVAGALMTLLALATVPGFAASFQSRTHDESSLWVRKNVAHAALNMIDARPLLGFGWNNFVKESPPYFRAASDYPDRGPGAQRVPAERRGARPHRHGSVGAGDGPGFGRRGVRGAGPSRASRVADRHGRDRAELPGDHQLRAVVVRVPDGPVVDLGRSGGITADEAGAGAGAAARADGRGGLGLGSRVPRVWRCGAIRAG
jgi:O-antigen ligase